MSFILTGVCGTLGDDAYAVFKNIAGINRGNLYDFNYFQSKINQVLNDTNENLDDHYHQLTSFNLLEALGDESGIVINGKKYKIEIYSPDSSPIQNVTQIDVENGKGYKIDNPDPGSWRIKIGDIEHKVEMTGKNNVTVSHGYTVDEMKSLSPHAKFEHINCKCFERKKNNIPIFVSSIDLNVTGIR